MSSHSAPKSSPTPARQVPPIIEFRGEFQFLSNFFPVPGGLTWQGLTGPTVEHLFQAAKTLDASARRAVLAAPTAADAKRIGRHVPLRRSWELTKLGVMAGIQAEKYAHPELAHLLLATGDAELIEGNHWCDTFWGVCTCGQHLRSGENWLGRTLMIQRSFLFAHSAPTPLDQEIEP